MSRCAALILAATFSVLQPACLRFKNSPTGVAPSPVSTDGSTPAGSALECARSIARLWEAPFGRPSVNRFVSACPFLERGKNPMAMEGKILGLAERAGGSVPAPISLFSEQGAVVLDPSGVKAGHRDFRGIRIRFRLPSGGFAYTTLFTEKGPGCSNIVVDPSGDPQFAKGAMGVDGTDCCEEISDPGTKNTSPEAARAILAAIEEALGAAAENQGFESAVPRPPTGVPHLARQPIRADRAETEGYLSRFQAAVDGVLGACSGLTNEASYQSRLSRLRQFEVSFLARHGSK